LKPITKQYLGFSSWPTRDKALWKAAFASGADLFDDRGPGSHLSARTISQLRYTYGKFLYFLSAEHRDLLKRNPAERVDATIMEAFVKWQPATCGGVTVSIYLYHLWLALRCLYPRLDWSWLLRISNRVKARAKAKPERHHLVTSEILYDVGMKLIDDALSSGKPPTSWRVQTAFRDGLIIALEAENPLRRRTLAALRIGKHLVKCGDHWELDIPAEDVKTKRPLDAPISPELSQRIDIYVEQIRPKTAGAGTHDYLWASSRGRPMGGGVINNAVRRRTRKALGFPVNLQCFRRAAPTLWSVRDPANVRGSKDLLGHASFATTEKYYVMSQSRLAGRALGRAIDTLKSNGSSLSHTRQRTIAKRYALRDERPQSGK
jgi:integrase/recombinase XerD